MSRLIAVLPALNEEDTIERVVASLSKQRLDAIVVVDNASTDRTAARARAAGAEVVFEPERGYGAAVLAGLARARELGATVLIMLDADGSDAPECLEPLLAALTPEVDLVLGVRDPKLSETGSLTLQQRLGNAFARGLMDLTLGAKYSDLPPFKVIRREALDRLELSDRGFGFTIELLLRAHALGLRRVEVPIGCRRRLGGESKVSGTLRGTLGAGVKIISSIAVHAWAARKQARRA